MTPLQIAQVLGLVRKLEALAIDDYACDDDPEYESKEWVYRESVLTERGDTHVALVELLSKM